MSPRRQLTLRSALVGFCAGTIPLALHSILYLAPGAYTGPTVGPAFIENTPYALGYLGPLVSAFIGAALSVLFDPRRFGARNGIWLALAAYICFCAFHGIVAMAMSLMSPAANLSPIETFTTVFVVNSLIGVTLSPFILVPSGALLGYWHEHALNKSFKPQPGGCSDTGSAGAA